MLHALNAFLIQTHIHRISMQRIRLYFTEVSGFMISLCIRSGKTPCDNSHIVFITLDIVAIVLIICKPTGHVNKKNGIVLFDKLIK